MKRIFVIGLAAFVAATFLAQEFSAQTRKTRPRKKRTTVATTAPTPVPQQPEIVSRESDTPVETGIITDNVAVPSPTPVVEETLDQKLDRFNDKLNEMSSRIDSADSKKKNDLEEKQKRLLMNLDILTRAEQRAETLRRQVFEFLEKEGTYQSKINQLEYEMRPEVIQANSALYSSMRPEEVREQKRRALESERNNLEKILQNMQRSRMTLEENLASADSLVKKLREKLEVQIDAALDEK